MEPGAYFLYHAHEQATAFAITAEGYTTPEGIHIPRGTVDYEPTFDVSNGGFFQGRGTATLTVVGYAITLDATQVAHPTFAIPYVTVGWPSTRERVALRMLPGAYFLYHAHEQATPFAIAAEERTTPEGTPIPRGTVDYDSALDTPAASRQGIFRGRGTATLTLVGYAITLDATQVAHPMFIIPYVTDDWRSTRERVALRMLPGAYFLYHAPEQATLFAITAEERTTPEGSQIPRGTVDYEPTFDVQNGGFFDGRGTTTLQALGYKILFDVSEYQGVGISLDPTGITLDTATSSLQVVRLLPERDLSLLIHSDPLRSVRFVVENNGAITLKEPYLFVELDSQNGHPLLRLIQIPEAGTVLATLKDAAMSGYLSGKDLAKRFPNIDTAGQYWIPSGIAGFADDAAQHFYLPTRYTDPFGQVTHLQYDERDLYIASSEDALKNHSEVTAFDFRVLAPREFKDLNGNLTEAYFDPLGMVAAVATKGKGAEGDNLDGFANEAVHPTPKESEAFFTGPTFDKSAAIRWLGNATSRHLYHFGETTDSTGHITWGQHPPAACGILPELHAAQQARNGNSRMQVGFEYSDGMGTVLVKKGQAEPESDRGPLRWLANGKTILNNKGKPVKQYEPYFSESGHRFEEPHEVGVTPLMYYDAVGRLIRTELPDGSFSRVEFSPWHVTSFDPNDTAYDPAGNHHSDWYQRRTDPTHPRFGEFNNPEDYRASELVKVHANTTSQVFLDSVGRDIVSVAHNTFAYPNGGSTGDEKHVTFTKLDAEGKPLWIRDARGNLVMQYIMPPVANNDPTDPATGFVPCYDIAGNLLFQHSMDASDRWMLNDAVGKPMFAWDVNERRELDGNMVVENRLLHTTYDQLHRSIEQWLSINNGPAQMIEQFIYGEGAANDTQRNLRGQLREHADPSGRKAIEACDFKGNVLAVDRNIAAAYKEPVIGWQLGSQTAGLEQETFVQRTEYDALNRMIRLFNWHRGVNSRVAVYEPTYNERGLLQSEDVVIRAIKTDTGYSENGQSQRTPAIKGITYNAKGQREKIEYGNGTITRYHYDGETFRLVQLRTSRPTYDPKFPSGHSEFKNDRVLQNLFYTHDPVGNITEIYDDAYEPAFFDNQQVDPRNQYTYDALYRLIAATGRENGALRGAPTNVETDPSSVTFPIPSGDPNALRVYQQTYQYDAVGNIARVRHEAGNGSWTRDYGYALDDPAQQASNRLWQTWTGGDRTQATTYTHDTHGNMQNLANVNQSQYIRWDYQDMIQELDLVGGGRAYYNYDSDKQRSRKVIETQDGTKQWERIDLGGFEWYRRYVGGNVVEEIETHHLMDGSQRTLLVEDVLKTNKPNLSTGPLYRYQYSNHLGSACLELDHQAGIISYEEYHPYGTSAYRAVKRGIEVPLKRYRYTGMERDEESGLNYHTARYFISALCRWSSADPMGTRDGTNLYAYSRCSPTMLVDVNGRQSQNMSPVTTGPIERYSRLATQSGYIREHWAPTGTVEQHLRAALQGKLPAGDVDRLARSVRNNTLTSLLRSDVAQAKTAFDNARTAAAKLPGYDSTAEYLQTVKDTKNVFTNAGATQAEIASLPGKVAGSYQASIVGEAVGIRHANSGQPLPKQTAPLLRAPITAASGPSGPAPVEVVKFSPGVKNGFTGTLHSANANSAIQSVETVKSSVQEETVTASNASNASGRFGAVRTTIAGVGMVGGAVASVAETVESARTPDTLSTVARATAASGQLTGGILWLSGKIAGDAAAVALGARIAAVSSLPGLALSAIWPSSVADGTTSGNLRSSYEPEDQPYTKSATLQACIPQPQLNHCR